MNGSSRLFYARVRQPHDENFHVCSHDRHNVVQGLACDAARRLMPAYVRDELARVLHLIGQLENALNSSW